MIPFNVGALPHALVAAVLTTEHGIGVRNGCFCAHPHVTTLLGLDEREALRIRTELAAGDHRGVPGMVRISFGMYNTSAEVDALTDALDSIARGRYRGVYVQDRASGAYEAQGWTPDLAPYFRLRDSVSQAIGTPRCA